MSGSRVGDLLPGVDLRGDGGYVVAPPSMHENGKEYEWEIGLDDFPLAEMPEWLKDRLAHKAAEAKADVAVPSGPGASSPYGLAALSEECEALGHLTKGTRNDALNIAACKVGQLIGSGEVNEHEARTQLIAACQQNGLIEDDGLGSVVATIGSGFNKGKQKPKPPPAAANDNISSCSSHTLTLIKASDIEAKPIHWLWRRPGSGQGLNARR